MKVKSKKQDRIPGIVISLILFVIECAFLVLLLYTKLISMKYIGIIAAGLLLLLVIVYFLVCKGEIVSRDALMMRLWQMDDYVEENTLTVNVNRLRKKLDSIGLHDYIVTKVGVGYLLPLE